MIPKNFGLLRATASASIQAFRERDYVKVNQQKAPCRRSTIKLSLGKPDLFTTQEQKKFASFGRCP
ncbi:MAG: hypothetical protein AAB676_19545 [Verrucomicrobiota bacterium]